MTFNCCVRRSSCLTMCLYFMFMRLLQLVRCCHHFPSGSSLVDIVRRQGYNNSATSRSDTKQHD